ncbi:hypothetical protein RDI58_029296 [Solanum bulbocastanum]|uniref:Uncharacterized protein n=1 Tax=Solanum bulbocastanum TaxID=147425 RepID=A0AAN8Y094_SOLBU
MCQLLSNYNLPTNFLIKIKKKIGLCLILLLNYFLNFFFFFVDVVKFNYTFQTLYSCCSTVSTCTCNNQMSLQN